MRETVILIADDDESDAHFLRQAFKDVSPRLRVENVPDGEQTIAYLSGQGRFSDRARFPFPDYLFIDVKMPRVSGFEVLVWLRSQPDLARLPVTVISGSHLPGDRSRAVSLGAEYVVKPVDFGSLAEIVRAFCRKSGLPCA